MSMSVLDETNGLSEVKVSVCVGTSCYSRGAQAVIKKITGYVQDKGLGHLVKIDALFCTENCDKGPMVVVGDKMIHKATVEVVIEEIKHQLKSVRV
jgi:NADH:ubiquinone oxidoreductase subunit E